MLDPRFKFGAGLSVRDKDIIYDTILEEVTQIAMLRVGENDNVVATSRTNAEAGMERAIRRRDAQAHFDDMFSELNDMRMIEDIVHATASVNDDENERDRASAEILLYKREPALALQRDDGTFNNPLQWWSERANKFPLLSEFAAKVLSIPATSAPSERVFSTSGITIAKERSRLDPWHANNLVFLHENMEESKGFLLPDVDGGGEFL